jgi:hypothetical protein
MPMKSKFTVEDIVEAAFSISREEGVEKCSARAIAHRMQSSTMPIYSCLSSMKELEEAVLKKSIDHLISYETKVRTGDVFLDMGIGYIMFAKTEKHLFRMLFLSEKREGYEDIRKRFKEYVIESLLKVLSGFEPLSVFTDSQKRELIDRMWVFNHGLAMLLNNSLIDDLNEKQIAEFLLDTGIFIIYGELMRERIYKDDDVKKYLKMSGFEYLCEQKGRKINFF